MSGNPFRRSQPPSALPPASAPGHDGSRAPADQWPAADKKAPARRKKHVRLASPPSPPEPSSPEVDDNLVRHLAAARHVGSPPPPATLSDYSDDDVAHELFEDSPLGQDSPDDDAPLKPAASGQPTRGETQPRAPGVFNPFERTLANIEPSTHQKDLELEKTSLGREGAADRPAGHRTKGSIDVDSFKRMLLTGNAHAAPSGVPPPAESQPRAHVTIGGDTSSGTDASSASRNSIFDLVLRVHDDSPRSSYERASFEVGNDDQSTLLGAEQTRAKQKPPPPKHRHGKSITRAPQTVSFSDFSPSPASPATKPDAPKRIPSNGQKPLPPRPRVASGQKPKDLPSSPSAETVPLKGAAESPESPEEGMENPPPVKTPELSAPQRRKPPTPPLARRHSQLKSSDARSRSNSTATMSSQPESALSSAEKVPTTSAPSFTTPMKPPPPPPTRRSGAISSSNVDLNANPTSRSSSRRSTASSMHKPSLNVRTNRLSGSALDNPSPSAGGPPPPPPRRASSKSSLDMQRPSACALAAAGTGGSPGESRRSSGEFKGRSRTASGTSERVLGEYVVKEEEWTSPNRVTSPETASGAGGVDLLSELDKLQQEIEVLRRQKSGTKA